MLFRFIIVSQEMLKNMKVMPRVHLKAASNW